MAYPRHRDRGSRYDDDHYASDPYGFDPRADPRAYGAPEPDVPRRHKSHRHRRPSPDIVQEDLPIRSRAQPRHDRDRDPSPSAKHSSGHRRHTSSPPRHGGRSSRHDRDEVPRDPYEHGRDPYQQRERRPREYHPDYAAGGYRSSGGRHRRGASVDDHDPGVRRSRTEPQSDSRHRQRGREHPLHAYDQDYSPPRHRRGDLDHSPPRHRRAASHARPDEYDGRSPSPRRRPRSQARGGWERSPSPRGRHSAAAAAAAAGGRGGARGNPRRSSMPPTTKSRNKSKSASSNWWQNPLIVAGARTALTAGAQAAMKNRNDPSPWMGSKGAKVATAALGAALVDGFMGKNKHSGGTTHKAMREGVDLASARVAEELGGGGRRRRH